MASKQIDFIAAGLVDSSGNPLQSGTVELYEAGTSTPVTGYADAALGSSLGSTITLDSRGAKLIFVDGLVDLKIIVKDSAGSTINTYDGLDYDASGPTIIDSDPEIVLQNTDQEDTDGGRQSIIRHKGEQSGGEVSTLATATASHDGSSDDEKGKYEIKVNDGNDGNSPSIVALSLKSTLATFGTAVTTGGALTVPSGGATITSGNLTLSAGNIVVSGTVDGVDVATLNTNYTNHAADATIHFTEGSIDHGNITGLGDDDHTQYSLVDGTRAFTGGVTVNTGGVSVTGNSGFGVAAGSALGNLHIRSATSGTVSVNPVADELIVEGSGDSGITILSGLSSAGRLIFGRSTDSDAGYIQYGQDIGEMQLVTEGVLGIKIDTNQDVTIPNGNLTVTGTGTVQTASSGTSAHADADELFVDGSGNSGITIGSGTTSVGNIFFGNSVDNDEGRVLYDHNANKLSIWSGGTRIMDFLGTNQVDCDGDFFPAATGTADLGSVSFEWDNLYLVNAPTVSSDERIKNSIIDIGYGTTFLKNLRPVEFKYNNVVIPAVEEVVNEGGAVVVEAEPEKVITHSRPHTGFIAQEVKQAMTDSNLNDWAGYYYDAEADRHGLRPSEFISVLVAGFKELEARVATLESA